MRPGPVERERDSGRGIQQRDFDAVRRREEPLVPVHRDGGDDHHRQYERGTDGPEETQGDEQAADHLAVSRGGGEESARAEADALHESTRAGEAVAAEPSECFLGAVTGHEKSDDEAGDE